jgi:hypothetical protein
MFLKDVAKTLSWLIESEPYWLHAKGKISSMTAFRVQELESLGFERNPSIGRRTGTTKKTEPRREREEC